MSQNLTEQDPHAGLLQELHDATGGRLAELQEAEQNPHLHAYLDAILPKNPYYDPKVHTHLPLYYGEVLRGEEPQPGWDYTHMLYHVNMGAHYRVGKMIGGLSGDEMVTFETLEDPDAAFWQSAARAFRRGPERLLRDAKERVQSELPGDDKSARLLDSTMPAIYARFAYSAASDVWEGEESAGGDRIQVDAQALLTGQKLPKKFENPREEAYVRSMNMLYHQAMMGQDRGFINRIAAKEWVYATQQAQWALPENIRDGGPSALATTMYAKSLPDIERRIAVVMEPFHDAMGIDPEEYKEAYAGTALREMRKDGYDHKKHGPGAPRSAEAQQILEKTLQRVLDQDDDIITEAQRVMVARNLLLGLADGTIRQHDVAEIEMLMISPAFEQKDASEASDDEQLIDWEVLPPHETGGEGTVRIPGDGESGEDGPTYDMGRIEKLHEYIKLWGGGYIARSRIPSLKEEKQYYLAILPQTVGGVTLEHAIGDNPEERRHAVYAWRAESGIGRFGQVQRTWREVFRQDKSMCRQLGARMLKHTATLEERTFEYLTRPTDELADKRPHL